MKNEKEILKATEESFSSIEGMERMHTDEFFFTRLRVRMQREHETNRSTFFSFLSKPIITVSLLMIFITLNITTVCVQQENSAATSSPSPTIDDFAAYYNMNYSSQNQ